MTQATATKPPATWNLVAHLNLTDKGVLIYQHSEYPKLGMQITTPKVRGQWGKAEVVYSVEDFETTDLAKALRAARVIE